MKSIYIKPAIEVSSLGIVTPLAASKPDPKPLSDYYVGGINGEGHIEHEYIQGTGSNSGFYMGAKNRGTYSSYSSSEDLW